MNYWLGLFFVGAIGGGFGYAILSIARRLIGSTARQNESYASEIERVRGKMRKDGLMVGVDLLHRVPGALCPDGYELLPGAFRRGTEQCDGCVRMGALRLYRKGSGSITIDFLLAGESFDIDLEVR